MRKTLLGTSALVAAGLIVGSASVASAAEPIKLGVSAEIVQWFGGGNSDNQTNTAGNDTTNYDTTNFFTDNSFKFSGSTKLDNGIGVTAIMSYDGDAATRNDNYVKFTSDKLGDLRFGLLRNAQDTFAHGAPDVGIGNSGGDYGSFVRDTCGNCIGRTSGDIAHTRANSIVYYTPRIGGAGIGVSYGVNANSDPGLRDNKTAGVGKKVGAAFVYEADIAGVGIGFDVGYTDDNGDKIHTSSGLNLSMNGFTVGGSWGRQRSGRGQDGNGTFVAASRMWDIGASYETGPYSVSLNYSNTKADQSSGDRRKDERKVVVGSVSYAAGAGLDVKGSVFHINSTDAANVLNNENSAIGAAVGVVLGF